MRDFPFMVVESTLPLLSWNVLLQGIGFALRYDHAPYMAKVKRLLNRDKGDCYYSISYHNVKTVFKLFWGNVVYLHPAMSVTCSLYVVYLLKGIFKIISDPYVSQPLLDQLREVMLEDKQLTSNFIHSIINHLNWCFSEFIGQMQEVGSDFNKICKQLLMPNIFRFMYKARKPRLRLVGCCRLSTLSLFVKFASWICFLRFLCRFCVFWSCRSLWHQKLI